MEIECFRNMAVFSKIIDMDGNGLSQEVVENILLFWFGDLENEGVPGDKYMNRWWIKDPATDKLIRDKFEDYLKTAVKLNIDTAQLTPRESLALIILLDQFSRNIYRDKPEAFSKDAISLKITLRGIEKGLDLKLRAMERVFYYMPLMHSEDPQMHELSLKCFKKLENEFSESPALQEKLRVSREYAQMHAQIISRFGRYPHRNDILGRESTDEEKEFLKQPGSSF